MMEGLTEGRIVHYVLPDGVFPGEHRPAIVVKVWSKESGSVNLSVFTDYTNDYEGSGNYGGLNGLMWATSVRYSEAKELGTWHWIEKA